MKVYHVTGKCNLASIIIEGIHPKYSLTKRRAVYLVDIDMLAWAIAHAAGRHGWRIAQVVILPVDLPTETLKKTPVRGIFYTDKPVSFMGPPMNALVFLGRVDDAANG